MHQVIIVLLVPLLLAFVFAQQNSFGFNSPGVGLYPQSTVNGNPGAVSYGQYVQNDVNPYALEDQGDPYSKLNGVLLLLSGLTLTWLLFFNGTGNMISTSG